MKNTMALQQSLLAKKSKKGFTLVELVVVIAILAILAAVAIPVVSSLIQKANHSADESTASTITSTLNTAYSEVTSKLRTDITLSSTVAACLSAYNVDSSLTCKTSGWNFYYSNGTCGAGNGSATVGNVTCNTSLTASVTLQTFMGSAHTA